MSMSGVYFVLLYVVVVKPYRLHPDFYVKAYRKGNACIGGAIEIITSPNNTVLNGTNCNVTFSKHEWQREPFVRYPNAQQEHLFTVMMLDCNETIGPYIEGVIYNHVYDEHRYYVQWLVINIDYSDMQIGRLDKGDTLAPYMGPNPRIDTGYHIYEFLIYKQTRYPNDVFMPVYRLSDKDRHRFHLRRWLRKFRKIVTFEGPVAGTQFVANHGGD